MTCAECGGIASVYDHRDYHKHLDVRPVCDSCNSSLPAASLDWKRVVGHIEGRDEFYRIPNTEAALLVSMLKIEKLRESEAQ